MPQRGPSAFTEAVLPGEIVTAYSEVSSLCAFSGQVLFLGSESLLFGQRWRDGKRHFLDPFAPDDVQHPNDSAMGGILVAADVNGDVGIELVAVRQNALQLHQRYLRLANISVA